ncbi:MAG: ABC transporter permease [Fimbriimonadaceae bacterium]|nr:ABC transporter permease [Chitinophagales bacterium]
MNFPFFISRRIVKNDARSFSRLIVIIARIAIALSLAVMIISSSMVNGFRKTISEKIYGFWGHINISKESLRSSYDDLPIDKNETFINSIKNIEGVEHIQVYARKAGIIKTKTDIEGIIAKGISSDFNSTNFSRYVLDGKEIQFNDTIASREIMISKSTADRLQLKVGDSAVLYFIDPGGNGDYTPRARELFITAIYNTGLEEFDKLFALVDVKQIQRLNGWNKNQVGGYEVFVKDAANIQSIAEQVDLAADPFWSVQTIQQIIPSIFDWLNLQKINERIILILMLVVALINMITSLLILILERTNMIGILKALGAANGAIQRVFLINAAYIISRGLLWGNILGLGICFLQERFGILKLPEQSYYVSVVPVEINYWWVLLLNAGTLILSLLFLIIPSLLVSKIQPIKAIRFS